MGKNTFVDRVETRLFKNSKRETCKKHEISFKININFKYLFPIKEI